MIKKLINDLKSIAEMTTTANVPALMKHAITIRRQPILEPLEITREKLDKADKKKKKHSAQFLDILDIVSEKKKEKNPEYEAETLKIRENAKKPEAKKVHKFKSAKWTHPNGHPRCLICGDEEPCGGYCNSNKTCGECDE